MLFRFNLKQGKVISETSGFFFFFNNKIRRIIRFIEGYRKNKHISAGNNIPYMHIELTASVKNHSASQFGFSESARLAIHRTVTFGPQTLSNQRQLDSNKLADRSIR